MACRELSGFNCRVANKPGVPKVHIFLFDVIGQYVYENDNLNYVSGYSATVLPTTYKPSAEGSSYSGSKKSPDIDLFLHQLTLSFPKMESEKRAEFEKLRNLELTIIFEDENNVSWIMGQNHPVKLEEFSLQSGAKGGANDYTAVFQSIEPYQLREIAGVSEGCFTSFSGVEQRRSVLTIANADALDFIEFSLAADDRIVNYTATPALQPTLWNSNPTILADDTAQLLSLFEAGGTILNFAPSYSSGSGGTVTIVVDSSDTSFGGLIVDDVIQAPSTIGIVLNLTTILSPEIANGSTIIQVSDSDGVLFSGGYGTAISGSGLFGTTNNAFIFVSFLYATTTTFTATVLDLPCSTVSYEYVFENTLVPCALTVDFDFYKGGLHRITVPYILYVDALTTGIQCPKYQSIHINIFGYIFNMYESRAQWHSSNSTFENDFTNLLVSIFSEIDPSSLVFSHGASGVDIYFRIIGINLEDSNNLVYCNATARGLEQPAMPNTQFLQSRVLNLQTFAPYGSIITHTDENTDSISGENLISITENDGIVLEDAPTTSNETIDNLGILWAFEDSTPYDEISEITTSAQSDTCLTPVISSQFPKCYDDFTSDSEYNYFTAKLDVSTGSLNVGKNIRFTFNTYDVLRSMPVNLTPTSGSNFATSLFNSIQGVKLLHYDFNPATFEYVFHLKVLASLDLTAIADLDNSARAFTVTNETTIFTNGLTAKINPYAKLNWTLPVLPSPVTLGSKNLTKGEWRETRAETLFATLEWVVLNGELTIGLDYDNQDVTVEVYTLEDYPTSAATAAISGTITEGNDTLVLDLGALSLDYEDFGFIVVTNGFGWSYVVSVVDFTTNFTEIVNTTTRTPLIWGVMDALEYIGSDQTEDAPVYETVNTYCLDCCGVLVTITQLDATNFEVRAVVTSDNSDIVNTVDISFVDFTGPAPIPTELTLTLLSQDGNEKTFTYSTLNFEDPVAAIGEIYGLVADLKNISNSSILFTEPDVEVIGL